MANQDRYFHNESVKNAFFKGFESKMQEVKEMGFAAARDKFNLGLPPGNPFPKGMSEQGQWFCKGEAEAISESAPN